MTSDNLNFTGTIAGVRLYTRALSGGDVAAIVAAETGGGSSPLPLIIHHYEMLRSTSLPSPWQQFVSHAPISQGEN